MKKYVMPLYLSIAPLLTACTSGNPIREESLTVAKAQREIKIGMSSAEVVEALGSPNIITADDTQRETWVYDRVSTNVSSSQSGVWLVIAGAGSSSRTQNQRTLTIVVKFDKNGKVRDFAYRTSAF
ncbi:MAG: outer membrane protein assembly factor BamE [Rickettsiales bacterium]|nr:outer membrane protein assembly factor BamE [Rickettsiales bacterium]